MSNKLYKYFKLILISLLSFYLYFFINNNSTIKEYQLKFDTYNISDGLLVFIFTGLTKYFFLALNIFSFIFLIYLIFKNNAHRRT